MSDLASPSGSANLPPRAGDVRQDRGGRRRALSSPWNHSCPTLPPSVAALAGAIIEAAAEVGADGRGAGGLKGYLRTVAQEDRHGPVRRARQADPRRARNNAGRDSHPGRANDRAGAGVRGAGDSLLFAACARLATAAPLLRQKVNCPRHLPSAAHPLSAKNRRRPEHENAVTQSQVTARRKHMQKTIPCENGPRYFVTPPPVKSHNSGRSRPGRVTPADLPRRLARRHSFRRPRVAERAWLATRGNLTDGSRQGKA